MTFESLVVLMFDVCYGSLLVTRFITCPGRGPGGSTNTLDYVSASRSSSQ